MQACMVTLAELRSRKAISARLQRDLDAAQVARNRLEKSKLAACKEELAACEEDEAQLLATLAERRTALAERGMHAAASKFTAAILKATSF